MTSIYAIHGAYASPLSFAHLKNLLGPSYNWNFFDYSDKTCNIVEIIDSIPDQTNEHNIIGHSMGGLIALGLCNKPWVKSVTTISCPLGGVDLNPIQTYLSRGTFMRDISKYSNFIKYINNIKTNKPVQHIVTTTGFNPWLYEPNDGVVTLRSQTSSIIGTIHKIDENHIEVLMSKKTAKLIKTFVLSD